MAPVRRRYRVEIVPEKPEEGRDLFSPDLDGYGEAGRTPTERPSPRSEPDLDCLR